MQYEYALLVKASTDEWLKSIHYEDIKKKIDDINEIIGCVDQYQ